MAAILITGAACFIWSNLVHHLLQEGNSVVGMDDLNDLNDHRMKHARLEVLGKSLFGSENEPIGGMDHFSFWKASVDDEAA